MLISETYRALNRQLHTDRDDYGRSSRKYIGFFAGLLERGSYGSVLDYGCGKGDLKIGLESNGITCVREYDPAIPGKDGEPEAADLVVCTDVLEHIEPEHLNAVLRHLRKLTRKRLFVSISTRLAGKLLADGRNAHLIVKPGDWWRAKLLKHFRVLNWEQRGHNVCGELAPKPHEGVLKASRRRTMTPEIIAMFSGLRQQINDASDAFSQVSDWRSWEGIGDEPADLTGALEVLEKLDDVDWALGDIARNSRKATMIGVKPCELVPASDWKRYIEKRFRVAKYFEEGGKLIMLGAPGVMVEGVTAVGAVAEDKRWDQVKASSERIKPRIQPAPMHGRRAIIACYGPSLKDTIDLLKAHAAEDNCDVVSVSGSHDYLIEHGIVPRYHIECDPRPHKTDNIAKSHPDTEYLIASTVHSNYFDKLEAHAAKVRLWHVSAAEHTLRLQQEMGEHREYIISGGGSVGLRSIPLLYAMGYRSFSVFAMDCSFKSDGETVNQWAGKHAGKRQDVIEVMCGDTLYHSSPILLTYATNFFEMVQKAQDIDIRLYGVGLLQHMVALHMGQAQMVGHGPGVQQMQAEEAA